MSTPYQPHHQPGPPRPFPPQQPPRPPYTPPPYAPPPEPFAPQQQSQPAYAPVSQQPFSPQPPPYAPQQPFGQPAQDRPPWPAGHLGPVPPGRARLVVDCSYNAMGILLAATGPSVVVDGQHRGSSWGPTVVDLPPGPHHLHVHTRYMGQIGKADAGLSLAPGQVVHLYYRAPHTVFSRGRLGSTPQRSGGLRMFAGILASAVLVVLLVVVIAMPL